MTKAWCASLAEYAVVAESDNRRVVMAKGLAKEFGKIPTQHRAKLKSWMEIWTKDREGAISSQKFKHQSSFTDGKGRRIPVYAFKSYQARLYGFSRTIEGKETFLVTAIDAAKKDNEADPAQLQRASREGFRILDVIGIR